MWDYYNRRLVQISLILALLFIPKFLYAQDVPGNFSAIPKESLNQSANADNIEIENANQTYYSSNALEDGYTQAILTGNVHILFNKNDIYADEIIIKFLGGRAKVLIAKGQVLVKGQGRSTVAREVFVYVENKDIQFLDPFTLQNGIYVRGLGIRFTTKDLTHLQDVMMTTSLHYYPRYSLNASEGWVEKDNDFMLYGVYLEIGQDPLVYFPLFYNNHYGTGMITNIAYDAYLQFMIFNTFTSKTPVSDEKLMFDYYQKLGMYLGNDYSRTDIGNLRTHFGMAYDYHTQLRGNQIQNVFEQVLGEGPSVGRSLRYNFSVDYDKQILQASDPNGLSIQYKGTYKELSDPDFVNQFETDRYDAFNIKDLFFSDNQGFNKAQSASGGGTEGRRLDSTVTMDYYGYNIQISSSLAYNLNPKSKEGGGINTFSPSYWENTPSTQVLPEIDITKSYLLYNLDQSFEDSSKIAMPIKLDISYSFKNINNYQPEGLSNKDVSNYVRAYFTSDINYDNPSLFFKLYMPLSLENLFTYHAYKYYDYDNDEKLTSSNGDIQNTLTANYSPELTFQLNDTMDIKNVTTLKTVYDSSIWKSGLVSANVDNIDAEKNNTYNDLTQSAGNDLKFEWVDEDWDYLSGYLEASYLFSYKNHNGSKLPSDARYTEKNHNIYFEGNFFQTTMRLETSNKYGKKVVPSDKYQPLEFTVQSTSIPFVTISNTYEWDRFNNTAKTNDFSFTASIPSRVNLASWLWFSGLDITIDVKNDFQNAILDYLNYKFSLQFFVTALWKVEFFLSGQNQRLFLYGGSAPSGQRRNFFVDFFKSLAFWSVKTLQDSNFKMQNLGLTVSHDLDEWVLKIGASLTPKVGRGGTFYFDTQFYAEVILKDLGMLSAPRMEQGSDAEDAIV